MIKAYLPPEKSVYSLPRAAPGSPKPSRPHIPVRRPAAMPVPTPETTPGHLPREPPRIRPEPLPKSHTPAPAPAPTSKASLKPPPTEPALGSTHPARNHPAPPPGTGLETIPATTNSRTISETTAPGTDLQTPGPPRPLRKPGITRVPRPSAPGREYSRAQISTVNDKITPGNAKFSHNYS